MQPLRIAHWNIENLFVYLQGLHNQGPHLDAHAALDTRDFSLMSEKQWQSMSTKASVKNKSLKKLQQIRDVILDINPDILMLNEVGGEASLRNFTHYFLNNQFNNHIIEGNSHRGIDVAYLTRKNLPLKTYLNTHKHHPIPLHYASDPPLTTYYFSRDACELHLHDAQNDQLKLVLILTHLKSKLDPENIDPKGKFRREAELKALVKIYHKALNKYPGTPIIVGGDFNGCAQRDHFDSEYEDLILQTDLMDVFDLCHLKPNQRYTQIDFPFKREPPQFLQLDYIFVSKALEKRVQPQETYVYRFKDHRGKELPPPKTYREKQDLPSDHYPVLTSILLDEIVG